MFEPPTGAQRAFPLRVHAPQATAMRVVVESGEGIEMERDGDAWKALLPPGARYGIVAEGPAELRFDPSKTLLDPLATEVWFPPGHDREAAKPYGVSNEGRAPLAVARAWPPPRPSRPSSRPPVVYEAHVKGLTTRLGGGTFRATAEQLPRLAELGVTVVELLPVHQFDPDECNYWGYMPLVFGAVHRQYAAGDDAAAELADLAAAAHQLDIEIWLDVVFNHSTEEDELGPTYNLRALADREYYVVNDDGTYVDDAGCGNILDAFSAAAQDLVMAGLDRFADLGVDGFRFDLTSILSRDPELIARIERWAADRQVRLIAEPWDLARYELGPDFPGDGWTQWNGRYRDDVRGFLRGEPGMVSALQLRVQGSPDLFDAPGHSLNFLTSHDGFTLYDLFAYDHKRNQANGHRNRDGSDDNRSWNCGWEGDLSVPDAVMAVRRRQLRNAFCLLMLSHGVPMFVAGDEFARTQGGNNNAYNQDNETSWVDWARRDEFADLEAFVRQLLELRLDHPVLAQDEWWGEQLTWFGVDGPADVSYHSRSLAWHLPGLFVMVNSWWEPLEFRVRVPGPWRRVIDTSLLPPHDIDPTGVEIGADYVLGPRSVVVLLTTDSPA